MNDDYDLDPTAPETVALQARFESLSDDAAQLPGAQLDLAYGDDPRQKLDVFSAGRDAPVLIFFHGGYWRAGSKNTRRFPALPWTKLGVSWVCVNYRLVPDSPLSTCVDDARAATDWLIENVDDVGLDASQFHLTGNSAGAHLAAMVAAGNHADRFKSLTVISGLFDLDPLIKSRANSWLDLTPKIADDLSPAHQLPPANMPILVGCGGAETQAFKSQSSDYASACKSAGNPVTEFQSPDLDHFQIIEEYGLPDSSLFKALQQLILNP